MATIFIPITVATTPVEQFLAVAPWVCFFGALALLAFGGLLERVSVRWRVALVTVLILGISTDAIIVYWPFPWWPACFCLSLLGL